MSRKAANYVDLMVFSLLVVVGVLGRWLQPEWNFTPTAAVAVFAGYWFARWPVALLVPVTVMVTSNLLLPTYHSGLVMATVYLASVLPVWMGRQLRRRETGIGTGLGTGLRLAYCGLVPAVVFFLTTNFAVWLCYEIYRPTAAGLLHCYVCALPFFRWMLLGDLFYVALIFGAYELAGRLSEHPLLSRSRRAVATARQ